MKFSQLITEFSEKNDIEIAPLRGEGAWSGEDSCVADFNDGLTRLEFHSQGRDNVRIETEICSVDPESDEGTRTLNTLLKGNLAMLKEQTGSLCLASDRKRVILYQMLAAMEMSGHEFTESVESFLDRIDIYRKGLAA